MSGFCEKCKDFIEIDDGPEQVNDAWIHVEKVHPEISTKDDIQNFIENFIPSLTDDQVREILAIQWLHLLF